MGEGSGPDERQHALALSYGYLNRRDRTEAEVREKLRRSGVPDDTARDTVATLTEQGLLDDERFARLFTHDKRQFQGWGNERISRGLRARGIDDELIERALDDPADAHHAGDAPGGFEDGHAPTGFEYDPAAGLHARAPAAGLHAGDPVPTGELGRALAVLKRRFPRPPDDRRERDRALGMLLRKGYESELALEALSTYARDR